MEQGCSETVGILRQRKDGDLDQDDSRVNIGEILHFGHIMKNSSWTKCEVREKERNRG